MHPTASAWCSAKSQEVSWQGPCGLQALSGGRGSHESRRGQEGTEWLPSPQTSNPVEAGSQTGRAPAVAPERADTGRQPRGAGPWGERVLVDVGFGLRNHAGYEFSLGPEPRLRGVGSGEAEEKGCPNRVSHQVPAFPWKIWLRLTRPDPWGKCQIRKWAVLPGARGRSAGGAPGDGPQGHRASHPPSRPGKQRGAQRMTQKRVLW